MAKIPSKPWGGRFSEPTNKFVERFSASVDFDHRLYEYDILGSIAHAEMLSQIGVLTDSECSAITDGLNKIREEIDGGVFEWSIVLEDVHMNIEARLVDLIGEPGKKLHTGRSRNDQIATDMRLWTRDQIDQITIKQTVILGHLLDKAEGHVGTIMPGFTHLQVAQPITFGHHLLAWFEMLYRDRERFLECRHRVNISPLGSAALAGTSFPIDREFTAKKLGFEGLALNSLDAVSDRDFAIEFAAIASMTLSHLSRWCEELVAWNSPAFDFIELPDSFCTGSSIMPQKKNPDVPELIRGKTGRVFGNLSSLLVLTKSQPLAYNRDNQEDKEALFDTADTLQDCLFAIGEIIATMSPRVDNMRSFAEKGFATATDLADYLVRKGVPFRDAHAIVGHVVAEALEKGLAIHEIELAQLQQFSDVIDADVFDSLTLEGSVAARKHLGGTAPETVRSAIQTARKRL
ncbi:MAG: argininosuccinate lyase [Pseudomonadota bacterium]|uniref:Fumarate lyase N-terminal domain-containing protein n=1 Tax=marine metagenome TaxID=408172 RepID=A0A381P2Y2_9ZZZZ|nr:argininosuccinate lyase [Pseudomonadota bacterium]HBP13895.1 argininosuccinate lyase [Gammaproteobacteria bacterium]|tara:strand:+ start:511 stop:1893 length:1383 start_codon:yes stop_codon:yes gene_type:complete